MKKEKLFYVYVSVDSTLKYKGKVKAENLTKAMEIAHEEWSDEQLDVIRACYVTDRVTGTMSTKAKLKP